MAVGTGKLGATGVGRALEAQGLMTLLQALADPEIAAQRLRAQADAEALAIKEREAADVAISKAGKAKAAAEAAQAAARQAQEQAQSLAQSVAMEVAEARAKLRADIEAATNRHMSWETDMAEQDKLLMAREREVTVREDKAARQQAENDATQRKLNDLMAETTSLKAELDGKMAKIRDLAR